jgi:hypothetical protein
MILLFANNAVSTIASPINAAATAVQIATGDGVKFPNPVVGQEFFKLTFVDTATGLITEICNCTARAGDILTIARAQEGTIAHSWLAGDAAKNMTTAQTQANFSQVQQAQAGLYNYAVDTGTPNSYAVALTPAVTTRIPGLYVRLKAANTNTGASTLNLGAGSFPIINPDGTALGANAIIGGGIFEVIDDGVNYQLISASQQAQSLAGGFTTGGIQFRPTNEAIAGWVIANATTIGGPASNATQLANVTAANLFAWHWNNFSNTQCPLLTSAGAPVARGLNAAADFAANRQITVLDKRGKGQIGVDTMGGAPTTLLNGVPVTFGNTTTPGSVLGQNLHTLITAELAAHSHNGGGTTGNDSPDHVHNITPQPLEAGTSQTGYGGGGIPGPVNMVVFGPNSGGANTRHQHSFGFTTDGGNGLSNTPHNTVDLNMAGTWYLKL